MPRHSCSGTYSQSRITFNYSFLRIFSNIPLREYNQNILICEYSSIMDYHIKTPEQLRVALRQLRHAQGISQSQFGRRVGLSQERISAIESHPEKITTDQLLTILMAMGMELVIKPRTAESPS